MQQRLWILSTEAPLPGLLLRFLPAVHDKDKHIYDQGQSSSPAQQGRLRCEAEGLKKRQREREDLSGLQGGHGGPKQLAMESVQPVVRVQIPRAAPARHELRG